MTLSATFSPLAHLEMHCGRVMCAFECIYAIVRITACSKHRADRHTTRRSGARQWRWSRCAPASALALGLLGFSKSCRELLDARVDLRTTAACCPCGLRAMRQTPPYPRCTPRFHVEIVFDRLTPFFLPDHYHAAVSITDSLQLAVCIMLANQLMHSRAVVPLPHLHAHSTQLARQGRTKETRLDFAATCRIGSGLSSYRESMFPVLGRS